MVCHDNAILNWILLIILGQMLEVSTVTQYMLEKKRKRKKRKYLDQTMTSKKIQKIMLKVSAKRIGEISSSDWSSTPKI